VPDDSTFAATKEVLNLVSNLAEEDTVLFLISGGGSALFENPLISPAEMTDITAQLLASGADIVEMNTIRKRLSAVKGGRFAESCAPAHIFAVALSDVLGDRADMIASGPAAPDASTSTEALSIAAKYGLHLSDDANKLLERETPKKLDNVEMHVTGSARVLCLAAEKACRTLGYEPTVLTDTLSCTARDAGSFLAAIARYYAASDHSRAFILGGETVVRLTGTGLGGRNQELVLSAADGIAGLDNTVLFSIGSDGTDGPTDAAGGWCDGMTREKLIAQGVTITDVLEDNDSYHALQSCGGLIKTGPTGTNVNDLTVLLIKRDQEL
jgi:hydroxypyruvate reductase